MTAIAGIVDFEGRPGRDGALRMLAPLAHRGDTVGVWAEGVAALGHRARPAADATGGGYPLCSARASVVLTADIRLDNRAELARQLGLDDAGEAPSDGAILLAAYERWGEGCAERLLGDFAFAIWDARQRRLVCARDHFGVRSLYLRRSGSHVAFATEIKGVLAAGGGTPRLDETQIAFYLADTFDDLEITFFEGVRRLPPAHVLVADENGVRLDRYWALDPARELRLGSDGEYAEAFRELFVDAVRVRSRGPAPVGAMLSGGLDSSSIACTAARAVATAGTPAMHTFSAVFGVSKTCDEREYIDAVLATGPFEPTFFVADPVSPLDGFDRMCWHQDGAIAAANLFLNWNLYKAAREKGVRVILDGFDGDTTVSHGTDFFVDLARAGKWPQLAAELRGYSRNFDEPVAALLGTYAWEFGLGPRLSPGMRRGARRAGRALRRMAGRAPQPVLKARDILNPALAKRVAFDERRRTLRAARPKPRTEREWHHWRLTWGVMPHTLEILDGTAAAHGLEVRFPFWDRRLVEFCLSLPPEQKVRRGLTRHVLRRAMEGILPARIQWRGGKSNLGPNFERALLAFERPRLERILFGEPGRLGEVANVDALRAAYGRFASGSPGNSDVVSIWRAITLALWLDSVSAN